MHTTQEYIASAEKLAKDLRATIFTTESWPGAHSQSDVRKLWVGEWSDDPSVAQVQYWIALHELGHIAHHHVQPEPESFFEYLSGVSPTITVQEAEAWEWSGKHSIEPITSPGAKVVIAYAMTTYVTDMGVREHDAKRVSNLLVKAGPKPNWHLLDWMADVMPEEKTGVAEARTLWPPIYKKASSVSG